MIVGMNDYPAAQRKASSESGHVQKTIFIQLRRKAEIKEKDIEIIFNLDTLNQEICETVIILF